MVYSLTRLVILANRAKAMAKLHQFSILCTLIVAFFRMAKVDNRNSQIANNNIHLADVFMEDPCAMNGF